MAELHRGPPIEPKPCPGQIGESSDHVPERRGLERSRFARFMVLPGPYRLGDLMPGERDRCFAEVPLIAFVNLTLVQREWTHVAGRCTPVSEPLPEALERCRGPCQAAMRLAIEQSLEEHHLKKLFSRVILCGPELKGLARGGHVCRANLEEFPDRLATLHEPHSRTSI
jgi:hypothetical protein